MAIWLRCPGCGQSAQVPDQLAGQTASCPHCKASLVVPSPAGMGLHPWILTCGFMAGLAAVGFFFVTRTNGASKPVDLAPLQERVDEFQKDLAAVRQKVEALRLPAGLSQVASRDDVGEATREAVDAAWSQYRKDAAALLEAMGKIEARVGDLDREVETASAKTDTVRAALEADRAARPDDAGLRAAVEKARAELQASMSALQADLDRLKEENKGYQARIKLLEAENATLLAGARPPEAETPPAPAPANGGAAPASKEIQVDMNQKPIDKGTKVLFAFAGFVTNRGSETAPVVYVDVLLKEAKMLDPETGKEVGVKPIGRSATAEVQEPLPAGGRAFFNTQIEIEKSEATRYLWEPVYTYEVRVRAQREAPSGE